MNDVYKAETLDYSLSMGYSICGAFVTNSNKNSPIFQGGNQ